MALVIALRPSTTPVVVAVAIALISVIALPRLLGLPPRPIAFMQILLVTNTLVGAVIATSPKLTSYLGPDANYYHDLGKALSLHWDGRGAAPEIPVGKEGFAYLVAGLYSLGGATRYAPVVVNAACLAMTAGIVWWTTSHLYDRETADRGLPLFLLLPGLLIWPPQLLREAPIFLLLAVVTALTIRLARKVRPATVVSLGLSGAMLFTFRGPVGLIMLGGLALAVATGSSRSLRGLVVSSVATGGVLTIVFAAGVGLVGLRAAADVDFGQLNANRRELSSTAYSGYGADVDISTPKGALSYLPVALVNFILGPAPWQVRTVRQLPALADAVAWWLLLPVLWRGIRVERRQHGRRILLLLTPALLLTASMALTTSNFGLIVRLRTQVIVVVLPLIAAGFRRRRVGSLDATERAVSA